MRTINPETRETVTVNVIDGALAVTIVGGGGGGSVAVDDITDAGTTGKAVLKAETGPLARTALGMSPTGSALAIAADVAAARTTLGVGATGSTLMNATTITEGRTALNIVNGSTVVAGLLQIGTTASMAMAGSKTLADIGGVVPAAGLPVATTAANGAVKKGVAVTDATSQTSSAVTAIAEDADLATAVTAINAIVATLNAARSNSGSAVTQLNALLASLRTGGVIS